MAPIRRPGTGNPPPRRGPASPPRARDAPLRRARAPGAPDGADGGRHEAGAGKRRCTGRDEMGPWATSSSAFAPAFPPMVLAKLAGDALLTDGFRRRLPVGPPCIWPQWPDSSTAGPGAARGSSCAAGSEAPGPFAQEFSDLGQVRWPRARARRRGGMRKPQDQDADIAGAAGHQAGPHASAGLVRMAELARRAPPKGPP